MYKTAVFAFKPQQSPPDHPYQMNKALNSALNLWLHQWNAHE